MVRAFGTSCLLLVAASSGLAQQPADSTPRSVDILRRPPPPWLSTSPALLDSQLVARADELRSPDAILLRPRFRDSFAAAVAMRFACGNDVLCESELERRYKAEYGDDLPIGVAFLGTLMARLFGAPQYRWGEAPPVPPDTMHFRR